ncbi:glycosyltransferase family 4 protein [Neolewinella lacunae]|uniref:Glycosyltransferase family 4 protein n=1 Tax=Neolewinella lacunae TaxID=1517758 RepID=A0A923PK76_9BACT|nr:glycosyltransferase family 4 protein [Neolewinella lacunae]MBC6994874.1 glycosyltransferase family 4 protein [Neolewinella lacunae]MDN3636794.1 glycosyltransferase family 4 protein [Neolewinella lacunae]
MKIAILGNYPPKACGIATFTASLAQALRCNLTAEHLLDFAEIIAIEEPGQALEYPSEVGCILPKEEVVAYRATANYLNTSGFALLIVQHEFGIFGGPDGSHLLELTDRLKIPLLVTCHTVLKVPSAGQLSVMRRLIARTGVMVVMSKMAKQFLQDVYNCPENRIQVIEHGVPGIRTAKREVLREQFGWTDQRVLFTFGLLSRGKGIETVIRALPAIIKEHPGVRYVVLGKTHPNVVRQDGEAYREWLQALAKELGVAEHVEMISAFASEQSLFEYLRATDLYVIPYPNEAQICSGTLAYAMGAGAAVVSTPFWYATELLADGRGRYFPFGDSAALAEEVNQLLHEPRAMEYIRQRAFAYGKNLRWREIGGQYLRAFADARLAFEELSIAPAAAPLAPLRLDHLRRMTDHCGLLQHAKHATPLREEGYCVDDNGRALVFTTLALREKTLPLADRQFLLSCTDRYLAYLLSAQHEDGSFRNFMNYQRQFLEEHGSEDSFGRALWGLGSCIAHPPRQDHQRLALDSYRAAIGHLDGLRSPRALAYGILSLVDYLTFAPDDVDRRDLLDRAVSRIMAHYGDCSCHSWQWFERYLTYDNGILPLALYRSLRIFDDPAVRQVAEASTAFLTKQTFVNGRLRPIGCAAPYLPGEPLPQFDQQPIEAMTQVLLYAEAHRYHGRPEDAELARRAYAWFVGSNDLGLPLYNPETCGAYDGLTASDVNQNQGAESLLAYLIARITIAPLAVQPPAAIREDKQEVLRGMLNGFTPGWAKKPAPQPTAKPSQEGIVSSTALQHYLRADCDHLRSAFKLEAVPTTQATQQSQQGSRYLKKSS